jgi:hypothetical protein
MALKNQKKKKKTGKKKTALVYSRNCANNVINRQKNEARNWRTKSTHTQEECRCAPQTTLVLLSLREDAAHASLARRRNATAIGWTRMNHIDWGYGTHGNHGIISFFSSDYRRLVSDFTATMSVNVHGNHGTHYTSLPTHLTTVDSFRLSTATIAFFQFQIDLFAR